MNATLAASAALASALAGSPAQALVPVDFDRHVEHVVHDSVPAVGQCAARARRGAVLPPVLDLEATLRIGEVKVRVTTALPGAVRRCVEEVLESAIGTSGFASRGGERVLTVRMPFVGVTPAHPPAGPPPSQGAPLPAVGQSVEVQWGAQWYPAVVLGVESTGLLRIHYVGWADSWDESVPLARVRYVAAPPPPPPPPPRAPQTGPNLIVNGGFEQSMIPSGTWQVLPQIPGWYVTSGPGFELQSGVAGTPFEGRTLLELDSHSPTAIAQDVATRRGVTYELRIAFSARPGTGPEDNRVLVLWDGRPIGRLESDGSGNSDTRWTVFTTWITATGARGRLELRDEGTPNSVGSYIDDVRLVPAL